MEFLVEVPAFIMKTPGQSIHFEPEAPTFQESPLCQKHRFAGTKGFGVAGERVTCLRREIEVEGERHDFADRILQNRTRSVERHAAAVVDEALVFYLKIHFVVSFSLILRGLSY